MHQVHAMLSKDVTFITQLTCSMDRLTVCGNSRSGLSFKYSLKDAVISAQTATSVNMRFNLLVYS